ncbi:hypothetical protein SDC9_151511 [bioreactor metagenome]|uniref:Uncharacterized protein n=1 Tax=bioreactor metagenome TaxID=1076179 RepID=A0A645EQH3_9ZZZZ
MGVLDVVLIFFALVGLFYEGEVVGAHLFLCQRIPDVLLVGENVSYRRGAPRRTALRRGHAHRTKAVGYFFRAYTAEITAKNPAHDFSLIDIQFQRFPIDEVISERRFAGDKLSGPHPLSIAPAHVLADGCRFFLCHVRP